MSSRHVKGERRWAFTNDLCRRRFKDVRSATGIPALASRTSSVVGGVVLIAGLVVALSGHAVAAAGDSSGTVVTMFSQPGDNGVALEFDSSNSTIVTSSLSTSAIVLGIADKASGNQWSFEARPRLGGTFATGYYADAVRDAGYVGRPVLDVSWGSRGCNTVAGSFEIRDLLSSASVITRLDLLYEHHCDGEPAASWGEVRVNEPLTSGLVVSSQSITWPAAGAGASATAVPVYVRNLGDAGIVLGSAGIAGDQPEFSIRSDDCSGQTLPPGGACALDVAFAPSTTRGPRTGRLKLPLGGAVDSVQLDGLVSVGTTSLVMHSQPGDYVGQGLDYDFTTSNATSTFGGGPYGINAWVTSGAEWWGVDMTPAAGHVLAPGYTGSGIVVFGDGHSCNAITGSFTVTQAVFSSVDNSLQHFAASFTQYCTGSNAALTGTLTYNYARVVTPPAGVSGLTATWSGSNISVNWVNPTSTDYRYTVVRVEGGSPVGEAPGAGAAVYEGSGTTATVTGVLAGTVYTVTAFAVDQYGNVSDPVNLPAPPYPTAATTGTVITMFSDPGDWVGRGFAWEFDPSNSMVACCSLSTSGITLDVSGSAWPSDWSLDFAPAPGATLRAGYYGDAHRLPPYLTGSPGLDVSGYGHGCNNVTGSFEIRDLLTSGTVITRLDLLYEQHCEDAPAALWGEVRVNEPLTSRLVVSSQSITWPAVGVGGNGIAVPVYVRNLTGDDVVVGSTAVVDDSPEFPIRSDGCSGQILPPGRACAVYVAFDPSTTYGPRTGRLRVPLGTSVDSVQLDGVLSDGTTPVTNAGVSGLTATASSPDRVSVSWVNPTSPDYRYSVIRIEQGTPTAEYPTAGTAVYHGTGTSTEVTGLIAGDTYTITAFAIDQHGNVSDPSNVVVVAGGRLAGLAFTPGVTTAPSLRLAWSSASVPPAATGIRICLQPATAATATPTSCVSGTVQDLAATAPYATFSGLASGKAYRATTWPDYDSATVFGAAASRTIAGSSFDNPASTKITYGSSLTLSTKLNVAGTTTALASAPVTLWARTAGTTTWTEIAARTTSSTGIASVTVKPTANTAYQWRYAGSGTHMSAVGPETINVAFLVAEHATRLSLPAGATTYLYGTVAPLPRYAYVYLQRSGVTTSSRAEIVYQKLPNGVTTWGYKLAWRPASKGTYYLRIYKPASATHAAGYGATLKVVVG